MAWQQPWSLLTPEDTLYGFRVLAVTASQKEELKLRW